jgi:hypothetical protein
MMISGTLSELLALISDVRCTLQANLSDRHNDKCVSSRAAQTGIATWEERLTSLLQLRPRTKGAHLPFWSRCGIQRGSGYSLRKGTASIPHRLLHFLAWRNFQQGGPSPSPRLGMTRVY